MVSMSKIRLTLVTGLSVLFVLASASAAMAAGWWRENANDTINVLAGNGSNAYNGLWSAAGTNPTNGYTYNTPHLNFTSTSNRCKTCHAVHGALQSSFRLLRNSSREDECNYCHMGPAGASQLRLYALDDLGFDVQGEHTLGSTNIPDSNINGGAPGVGNLYDRGGPYGDAGRQALYCYSCHSVHGAGTIQSINAWREKILRQDPAGNGGTADAGLQDGINGNTLYREDGVTIDLSQVDDTRSMQGDLVSDFEVKKAFCGDCHNKNYNFRVNIENGAGDEFGNGAETEGRDYSLTKGSHPMNDNQRLDMGGGAGSMGIQQVSTTGFTVDWCGSCHGATSEIDYGTRTAGVSPDPWNQAWKLVGFPHQSKGPKFFSQSYSVLGETRDATQTNDAYEPVPFLDGQVCMNCHRYIDATGPGGLGGVGLTF